MAKPANKVVAYLQYLGLRIFEMVIRMFPVKANYGTATLIGDALFFFDRRHRLRAIEHLRKSFPHWSEAHLNRVARESMRNMVYLGLEVLLTPDLITPATWRRHVTFVNQRENILQLLRQERGAIYITGHFGNWEVTGYTMARVGFPVFAVARPLDNPYLNEHILGVRQRTGMTILDKKGVAERVDDILDSHGAISFIADQDAGRKGMFVDFFGRKASTYKSIGLMAMRHEVPVIVGYGRRMGHGFKFEIGIDRIIRPEEWADQDNPLEWITQAYTASLEHIIRTAPEQYLWVHRRWKHRPKGEPDAPGGIA
ncbi:MAG: lysophospholipid acyltransferase family protein [Planctomycetota bacterium]|jgi:KDO2-lipid IV(A) lauroyltransferase